MLSRLLIVIAIVLFIPSIMHAEPFLVYNPTPVVQSYELQIDSADAVTVEPTTLPDGTVRLVYDLAELQPGRHAIRARAQYEIWGWIPWSEDFIVIRPEQLTGPQVVTTPPSP